MRGLEHTIKLRQQLVSAFTTVEQHHHAALLALNMTQAVFQTPAVQFSAGLQRIQQG